MKKLWTRVLKKWEYKREQKRQVATFLKTYNLKLLKRRETSIILGCFSPIASSTKKGKFDLADADGNILDTNLSELEVSKRMEVYTKAAKKEGVSVEEYLKRIVNLKKYGFKLFSFSNRFEDHLKYGHINIQVINNTLSKKLSNGLPNPNYIDEVYDYVVGKGGRLANSLTNGKAFKVKSWGGSHFLENIDNINVRIATPKNSLSGNIATYKLPTGETVRKVQLEYYIKEIDKWKLKNDASTMWPKEWDIEHVKKVIKGATESVYFHNGDNLFRGITKEKHKIEFRINRITKEIDTAYLIF